MSEPIPVSRSVLDGIEAFRQTGETNMLDRPRVVQLAHSLGLYEAALWVHDHRDPYARRIFAGFHAVPAGGDARDA